MKGNQMKLLRKLVALIIDRYFLAQFTYSGRSVKGQRKNSFKKNENIIAFLYSVANRIDKNYEKGDFEDNLKVILKYAGE